MKTCSTCKIEKPFSEFSKNKTKKDGYSHQCKSCVKLWKIKNKKHLQEYMKEHNKKYYEENKDKLSLYIKKYREQNKDKLKENKKEYRIIKPEVHRIAGAKYRAKKLNATPLWLTDYHFESIDRFYIIAKEMTLISGILYQVDHIIPLQGDNVCGLHVPWNLQILEKSTNCSKGNKLLEEYL